MRRLGLVMILAASLAAPATAAAQSGQEVARSGESVLRVRDDGTELCLQLQTRNAGTGTCDPVPARPYRSIVVSAGNEADWAVAAAVPPSVTRVVVTDVRGATHEAPTGAGEAYTGRARGRVRFALVALPLEPGIVRYYDGSGALVGADETRGGDEPIVAGPVTLARRSRGSAGVRAVVREQLAPSLLVPDRMARQLCVEVVERGGSTVSSCRGGDLFDQPFYLDADTACAPGLGTVYGIVDAGVARVRLTLGDGRTRTVGVSSLASLGTDLRAVVARVPRGIAVRAAAALDASGAVVGTHRLRMGPTGRRCASSRDDGGTLSLSFSGVDFDLTPDPAPVEGQETALTDPEGARLVVREDGEFLCVGVARLAADKRDCIVPEPDPSGYAVLADPDGRPVFGGVVPSEVAFVDLDLEGGRTQRVPTSASSGYTGRYRDHVRFWLTQVQAGLEVYGAVLRDADGVRVGETGVFARFPAPRVGVVARAGGFRFVAGRVQTRFRAGERLRRIDFKCLGVAFGTRTLADACNEQSFGGRGRAMIEVACAPRRAVATGDLPSGVRGVVLEFRDGRALAARAVRVPARLGGGRVWLATWSGARRLQAVRFLGRLRAEFPGEPAPRSRQLIDLPGPSSQCGYVAAPEGL